MTMKMTVAIDTSCRREELFPWVADPHKAVRWQKAVKGGRILRETPEKIGTTFVEEREIDVDWLNQQPQTRMKTNIQGFDLGRTHLFLLAHGSRLNLAVRRITGMKVDAATRQAAR